jgi:hypothetical protein
LTVPYTNRWPDHQVREMLELTAKRCSRRSIAERFGRPLKRIEEKLRLLRKAGVHTVEEFDAHLLRERAALAARVDMARAAMKERSVRAEAQRAAPPPTRRAAPQPGRKPPPGGSFNFVSPLWGAETVAARRAQQQRIDNQIRKFQAAEQKFGPIAETDAERLIREYLERKGVTKCEAKPVEPLNYVFPRAGTSRRFS